MRSLKNVLDAHLKNSFDAVLPFKLVSLWRNWVRIVGPEVGELAWPLKHAKTTLILGCEDALAMQEASYYVDWILQEANAFLECNCFRKVQFELLRGRRPLNECFEHLGIDRTQKKPRPAAPPGLGTLDKVPTEDTPEGRAYRSYVKIFGL